MQPASEHIDVSTKELEALLEQAMQAPLQPDGYQKLKAAIRTLGYVTELLENREATLAALRRLLCQASTEKTAQVLKQAGIEVGEKNPKPAGQRTSENATAGHGRHEAGAVQLTDRGSMRGRGCRPPQTLSVQPSMNQACPGSFARDLAFKLGEGSAAHT